MLAGTLTTAPTHRGESGEAEWSRWGSFSSAAAPVPVSGEESTSVDFEGHHFDSGTQSESRFALVRSADRRSTHYQSNTQ